MPFQFQIENTGFSMLLWYVSAIFSQNILCAHQIFAFVSSGTQCRALIEDRNRHCPNSLFIVNILEFASSNSICWSKSGLKSFGWCYCSHYFIQVSRWAWSLENFSALQKFWRYCLALWVLQSNESQPFIPPSNMFFHSAQHTLRLNNWYISPCIN